MSEIRGIESVSVSLVANSMTVKYKADQVTVEDITNVVQECGFDVSESTTRELSSQASLDPSERTVQIQLQGMFCKYGLSPLPLL